MKKAPTIPTRLDECFSTQDKAVFANKVDYPSRFQTIADFLSSNVHTQVERGAILAQLKSGNVPWDQLIYLTCHGPEHVDCVMERATAIIDASGCDLNPYETFILLAAIHFHDVGNVYGRENHENRCNTVMEELGKAVLPDNFEKRIIIQIAASHGGCVDGNKDTIGRLEAVQDAANARVRKRLLAAILRFADELADDRKRASRFMLGNGLIPQESRLYHAYASCLHSVMVDGTEVRLTFEITEKLACEQFRKSAGVVYLLDEIYIRTLKMHLERAYCMRFIRDWGIGLDRIGVWIEVVSDPAKDTPSIVRQKISYTLQDAGYPENPQEGIFSICPDLKGQNGEWLEKGLKEGFDK